MSEVVFSEWIEVSDNFVPPVFKNNFFIVLDQFRFVLILISSCDNVSLKISLIGNVYWSQKGIKAAMWRTKVSVHDQCQFKTKWSIWFLLQCLLLWLWPSAVIRSMSGHVRKEKFTSMKSQSQLSTPLRLVFCFIYEFNFKKPKISVLWILVWNVSLSAARWSWSWLHGFSILLGIHFKSFPYWQIWKRFFNRSFVQPQC